MPRCRQGEWSRELGVAERRMRHRLGNNTRTAEPFDTESVRALEFAAHSALAACGRARERPTETTTLSLTEAKLASRPCPGDPKYTYRIKYLLLFSAIRQRFLAAKSI